FLDRIADVLLLIDSKLNQVRTVIDAAGISIDQSVDALFAVQFAGMGEFVLQLLDAIGGEGDEQLDPLRSGFRITNLVRFGLRQIVLLLGQSRRDGGSES